MKRPKGGLIILAVLVFMFCSIANAASLRWDVSTGEVDGYNVYFISEGIDYNKDVGNVTEVAEIDSEFNLHPGKEYIFTVTAYNIMGESEQSNTAIYTTPIYTLPDDNLPSAVIHIPGPVTIIVE